MNEPFRGLFISLTAMYASMTRIRSRFLRAIILRAGAGKEGILDWFDICGPVASEDLRW